MDAAGSNSEGTTPVNVRIAEGRAYEEAKRLEVDRQFARRAAEGHRQSEAGRVQEQARIAKEGAVRLSAFTARQQADQTARARFEDAAHAAGAQKQEDLVAELRRSARQMILRWVAPASKLRACRGLYRHLFPVPLTQSVGRFRRMTFDRPIRCIKGIRPSGSRRRHGMRHAPSRCRSSRSAFYGTPRGGAAAGPTSRTGSCSYVRSAGWPT